MGRAGLDLDGAMRGSILVGEANRDSVSPRFHLMPRYRRSGGDLSTIDEGNTVGA